MNFKFLKHILVSLPLLPVLYFQGKSLRRRIPELPDAEGGFGNIEAGSDKVFNIIFLGESSLAGVGVPHHKQSFVGYFSKIFSERKNVSVQWSVYAKSKYNAEKIKNLLLPEIVDEKADFIIIGTGGNDSFELTPPDVFIKNLQQCIVFLRKQFPETPLLFVQFPPVKYFPAFTKQMRFVLGVHTEILEDALQKIIKNQNNIYFNKNNLLFERWASEEDNSVDFYFSDGIHPSEKTYEKWAAENVDFVLAKNIF